MLLDGEAASIRRRAEGALPQLDDALVGIIEDVIDARVGKWCAGPRRSPGRPIRHRNQPDVSASANAAKASRSGFLTHDDVKAGHACARPSHRRARIGQDRGRSCHSRARPASGPASCRYPPPPPRRAPDSLREHAGPRVAAITAATRGPVTGSSRGAGEAAPQAVIGSAFPSRWSLSGEGPALVAAVGAGVELDAGSVGGLKPRRRRGRGRTGRRRWIRRS